MELRKQLAYERMVSDSVTIVGRTSTAMALRLARSEGCYEEVARMALDARRSRSVRYTLWQREWQTKVSRRPQRGRHHDSWSIRENYVRCR